MKWITIAVSLIAAVACNGTGPTPGPTPVSIPQSTPPVPEAPPPPSPPSAITQVRIVSGWDDAPVTNATVRIDGVARPDAADGTVTDVADLTGRDIEIETRGFLPRKTRIISDTVTLWPAAGAREAEAIKQLLFYRPDDGGTPSLVSLNIRAVLSLDAVLSMDERVAFEQAADRLNELIGEQRFAIAGATGLPPPIPNAGDWRVLVGDTNNCILGSSPAFGFCLPYLWFRGAPGEIQALGVTREAMNRPGTPLRLLAMANIVGSNPLRGLLTAAHGGETELSLLEQQALRMLSQRKSCTKFPDDDRISGC
ncbi:MAG: hypothetical protein JJE40_18180 [Vicinamibacteria bacterium]|nr:hypothetical protein [Vicinamibacteria bacterium]